MYAFELCYIKNLNKTKIQEPLKLPFKRDKQCIYNYNKIYENVFSGILCLTTP